MSKMNEAKKRDFIAQIISLVEEEQATLTAKGFDPADRLADLKIGGKPRLVYS